MRPRSELTDGWQCQYDTHKICQLSHNGMTRDLQYYLLNMTAIQDYLVIVIDRQYVNIVMTRSQTYYDLGYDLRKSCGMFTLCINITWCLQWQVLIVVYCKQIVSTAQLVAKSYIVCEAIITRITLYHIFQDLLMTADDNQSALYLL